MKRISIKLIFISMLAFVSSVSYANSFNEVGDILTIPSLSVGGQNYAVTLQVFSHKNAFSASFSLVDAKPTSIPATSFYNSTTGLVFVPGVKTYFQGLTGNSCVIYDVSFAAMGSLWATWVAIAKGYC